MRKEWPAALIALAFLILAVAYGAITPIFESPDELWHYPYVWHVVRTWTLPVQDPSQDQLWEHEGSQPPAYYAGAALLTTLIPADDLPSLLYLNPHADIGRVTADGNVNIVVHTPREEWPWRGAVLAIHVSRIFSALLATGTVLATYALGRMLWPKDRAFALLAMSFVAFNPMFLFIAGSVSNDNMITLASSLVLWQLAALWVGDEEPPIWRFVVLGLLCGLAALSKLSGVGIVGLVGLTLLVLGIRRRSWRIGLAGNGIVIALTAIVAGWWYWRNITLYGDWGGTKVILEIMPGRAVAPTLSEWLVEASGLLRSYWGVFGYFSILMPTAVYAVLYVLLAAGAIGLLSALIPAQRRKVAPRLMRLVPLLLLWIGMVLAGLVWYTLLIPSSQGRLIFPAISALAVLWAAGLTLLAGPWLRFLPILFLVPLAVWVPWGLIRPAYALPDAVEALPGDAQRLDVAFADTVALLGYTVAETAVQPGQPLEVTLYWQGLHPTDKDYSVFLYLEDEYDLVVAQRDIYHGPGVYPTSQWQSGQVFADTYVLSVPDTAFAPAQAQLAVGLYDLATGARLLTSEGADRVRFGDVSIQPRASSVPNAQQFWFEDGISLVGYDLDRRDVAPGGELLLTLYWEARAAPSQRYKVFVHVVGDDGTGVAQHDSEPQSGASPTSDWVPGQVIADQHPLRVSPDAAPGAYRIIVGLYDGETGDRLQVVRDSGGPTQFDAIPLSRVRVLP